MNKVYVLITMIIIILYEVYFIWRIKYEDIVNNSYKESLLMDKKLLNADLKEKKEYYKSIQTNAWIVRMNEKNNWVSSLKNKWETIYTFLNNWWIGNLYEINTAKSLSKNYDTKEVNTSWMKKWQKWIYYIFNINVIER